MELSSEKCQQKRGKLRANKGDTEGTIRDMTTEKQNSKKQAKKWSF